MKEIKDFIQELYDSATSGYTGMLVPLDAATRIVSEAFAAACMAGGGLAIFNVYHYIVELVKSCRRESRISSCSCRVCKTVSR